MSLTPEETRELYKTLGELSAKAEESRKQSEELFKLIHSVKNSVTELRVDVAAYRLEFNNHMEGEENVLEWIQDYRSNKNKILGMLLVIGVIFAFFVDTISHAVKTAVNHLLN